MPIDSSKLRKVYATLQQGGYEQDYDTFARGFTGNDHYANRKKVYDLLSANGAQVGDSYEDFMQRMQKGYSPRPLTGEDRRRMAGGVAGVVAQAQASLRQTKNRMDHAMANAGLRVPGVTVGDRDSGVRLGQNSKVVAGKPQYNPQTGKTERTYITESGNEYTDRASADLEQNGIDEARFQTERQEAYLLREKRRIEQEMNRRGSELDAEAVNFSWRDMPRGGGGAVHTYNSATANGRFADGKYKALLAQLNKVNDGLATIEEAKRGRASDRWIDDSSNWASKKGKQLLAFGAGAWRGLAHAVGKPSTWDMGMTDMTANVALHSAAVDADRKGTDNLSREDRDLLNLTAYTDAVKGGSAKYLGRGYKAGQTVGESLPFMVETMLNPASKLGTAATDKLMREAIGRYGKEAVKKASKRYLAAKIGTRLVGDAAGSAVMAGTTGQGHVLADALNRLTGDVQFKADDSGKIVYGDREGAEDSVLKAYLKAFGAQAIENHSEMVGAYFAPFLGKASSLTRKGMGKIGLGRVNKFIDDIGATNTAKMIGDFEKRTKWNGTLGEYAEEVAGNIENALLVGDSTLDTAENTGVFNLDRNIDTFLGVGLMGGFFAGANTLSYRGPKRQAINEMSAAGKAIDRAIASTGNYAMAERWGGWRNTFLAGTDEEKKAALREVMDNGELPMGFRMGVLDFVKAAQKYEGIARAQESKVKSGEQDPVAQAYDESYSEGYETTAPQAMNDAKNLLDMRRGRLAKELGTDAGGVDALVGGDPLRYIEERRRQGRTDGLQAVIDYANAKSAYDGMMQRVQDDIDSRVEESDAAVDSRVNSADGMIHPATLKLQNGDGSDRRAYVVSGNVVMYEDGRGVDREKSDSTVVIRDAVTGEKRVVPPDLVLGMDAAIDPGEEKARAREAIIEEMSQRAAHSVDGRVPFNAGDTYTLTGENGEQTQVTLAANEQGLVDNGDGTVNVTADGGRTVAPMSREDIQRGVDATNMARTMEAGRERQAGGGSVQVAPGGVEYGVNDTFTLLDGAGATVHGEVQGVSEDGVEIRTDEPWNGRRVQVIPAAEFEEMVERISDADGNLVWEREYAGEADAAEEAPGNPAQQGGEPAQRQPEAQGVQREAEASALSRVPINEDTGEPMFEKADSETALDALGEVTGGSAENTAAIVNAQLEQAQKAVEALRKKRPTKKAAALKGSPMAMAEAQRAADAAYSSAMERYGAQVAEAEGTLDAWTKIHALMDGRKRAERERQEAERRERDAQAHDAAVAQVAEQKRVAAEKAREQAGVGAHAVNPKIKAKWDKAAKVEGNANAITLADGSTLRGRYVLTEAGAASASHDISNAFEPTEGFPVDENGESVNDRDYKRDTDARRIVRDMARNYDGRALQPPVIVSKDGVVLSGNNRTMSGDLAAQQGTDGAYVDYLREFGLMYGFTPEQVDGMKHPRVVFVPDVELPYDAATFARFNAETQKRQGKDAQAVKLGKVVPDSVFSGIVGDISRYDRLSDYYADSKAVSAAISRLLGAGVINEMQLPEMRTGNALSAAGKELIENTLIGKVFQSSPDAVRQVIATPTLRQSVMMALGEIARNRTLARSGYGLSQELGAAVGLVARARGAHPDIFKDGVPVSPFGRQQGLFDDEYGDSRVTDAIVLLLADILNSGKPSDLRKVLATYNNEAEAPAGGQMDMFSGKVETKEELLNRITEYFRNATPREQQAIVDAAVAERKKRAEAAAQAADGAGRGGGNQAETASENGSIRLRNDGRGRVEGHPNQRQGDLAETGDVDENGHPFISSSDGTTVFGEITEDSGLTAAPIKLSEGFNNTDEKGNNIGYGLLHIKAGHGQQILEAGYPSVEKFVEDVCRNYKEIRIGRNRKSNQTYMLLELHDEKHKRTLYVELSHDGTYWNVNSGGIFRNKYTDRNDIVWPEPTVGSNAITDTAEVADSPTEVAKGETVDRGGNSSQPISSAGKDTSKTSDKQGNGGKKEKLGYNSKTGKWKGVPIEADVLSGKADRNGIITGYTNNPRVEVKHYTVTGRTWIRVHTYDKNAETPVRINRILEQEGYYVDIDGLSSGFVDFDNYEDAMRFADHVNDVQSQVDAERLAERLAKQLEPVGKGVFGDIYDQFRGDAKGAFSFLTKHRSGDLLGVFHRDDTGDIDLVWGDENGGLCHILAKHVGKGKDFGTEQAAFDKIESILKNGRLVLDGQMRYVVSEDGYRVAIRKDYDGVNKNWIVTAVDYNRSKEEKGITTNPTSASHGANGPELAAPNNSNGKDTSKTSDLQGKGGKSSANEGEMPLSEQIEAASAEADTEPTEAQKEAGNYRKGHVQVGTFDITIEQPEGSVRRGTDAIKEFEEANEHLGDVEQEWEDRILDYVYEHYPTQATVSAETTSPKGIKEREAMKNDPVLKRMRKESDTAFNEADKAVTEAWMRMEAAEAEREKKKSNNLQPIGKGLFGNVYDQFRGKAKEAFAFLREKGSGDALGVFHRNGVGDIDVVWGDKGGGLDHIISKHVGDGKSFLSVDEAAKEIDDIIRTGDKGFENGDKIVFKKGSKLVTIRKNVRENGKKTADKNWVLTAYDELSADGDVSAIAPANQGQAARTTGKSRGKDTKKTGAAQVPASGNDKGLEERREKIDDAGEKIDGARKDAMRKLAESMEQATEEALVAMPFSKAFKRPNLKKAVEDGVLREEDALFAQAVMSAYLSRKKPLLSKSSSSYKRERSERDVRDWARHARKGVELLKKLFSLSPSERDAFMREETSRPAYDQEVIEENKRQLSEWNPGKVFNGTCYPVNPVKLWLDVYARLGYEAGTDVPQLFSAVEPSGTYGNYRLIAANGNTFYPARKLDTYDAAVNEIVYQTKVANADADTDHPKEAFRVEGTGEAIKKPAGKWRVVTQDSLGARIEYVFNSKEEAEKFAKAYLENDGKKADKYWRYASAPAEVMTITGFSEYAVVLRRSDAGSGTHTDFELKRYGTEEEATAAIEVEHDELNGLANKALAKEKEGKGGSSSARKPACSIVSYTEDGKAWKYGIKLSEKYAPKKTALSTMPYYLADGFSTRKEAQEYLDAHIGEYEAKAAEIDEARRSFRYFTGNGERVGNDYRKGEDVTAEQLREQFGFRGVQFGNWTNQRDRQEAVNQAFDAFMDLSRILGVSPKALSLNGELGVAFGARGSGKASAHYEPAQVVINLTKTRGSGALAHEWWHALDNYFARQGNVAKGYVTESKSIGMRDELRRAFDTLTGHLGKSPYHERSRQKGTSYWGSATEETARMFEQWVNDQLAQRGERSPFLTDADPYAEERYAQDNYELYKRFLGDRAMPYEEFKQTPQALYGFVYLTRDELQAFGKDLKHIFDTIQQKVDETTGKTLMYHKGDVVAPLTSEERVLRDAVIDRLRDGGMEVITDVEEGQRVLDEANGEERMEAKRVSPRRQWLNSYVEAMHLATGRDKKAIRAEVEQKIADIRKETKELYTRVLSGDFNDVTLQLINNYIDSFTPYNEYWRPLSKRLPPKALRSLRKGERTGAVDALFSRICESAVEKNGRAGADGRRKIEEKKEELLKKWAIATGSWHTDVSDFGVDETPIGSGKDSVVYQSGDGKTVVKASRGKFDSRKFPSDIDHVALFNYIFPESRYEILGYGEVGGKFVKFLRQPFVDFSASVPLTAEERTEYMRKLGFEPMNEEKTVFSNSSIVVSDLQKSNIVRDKSGNVRVIDADVKLHTRDIGGNYTYPDVETDTEDPKAIREHRVYHGSGADFDAFDHSHMGEGEGAQAYGWGTYVTEVEGIGRTYAIQNTTKRNDALRALQHDVDSISGNLARHRDGLKYAEEQLKRANEWRAEAELDYELFQEKAEELKREYGETSPEYQNHLFNDIYTDEMKHARRSARDTEESIRYHKEKIAESEKALKDKQAEIDELPEKFPRHLYTVEIPDDNGGNYIDYNGRIAEIPPQKTDAICAELEKLGWKHKDLPSMVRLTDGNDNVVLNPNATGADLYEEIKTALKSAKQASLLLSRAGFAGIKYPADNMRGGRADGAKNYVVFDEKDARIAGHVRFFRTAEGEAYGFTVGGKIYIDPGIANAETPVHEYAHLWASALEAGNPKEWRNVVGLVKGTPVWDEVKRRYPELETDDEIADEVLATYSGRRGAERLREEAKRITDGGGSVFDKAEAVSALGRVKAALERFWKAVADFLHIRYTSAEEVADRVMKDLLDGVDPRKFGKENGSVRMSAKKKRAPETVSVSREKKHQPTAVSSADGAKETATIAGNPTNKATGVSDAHAKVQTNLDSLAKSYGKKGTNKTRGFITDLSRALGLEQHEASNYGSFDLPNGNRLAIRVSNHNARVSNFDRNNEDNGISIVISSHRNKGLDNDGTAHLVEFFYNRRSIENAEGKPLAEIVKSIKQALYSGEFKDTTGLAERQEVNAKDAIRFQSVGERAGEAVDVMKFRLLEADDPKAMELEALPDSELVPVYRNVQAFEDDALGSPMAFTDAGTGERRTLEGGKWNYSNPPEIHLTDEQQRKLDELNKNGYIMVDGKKTTELPINEGLKFVKPKTKEAQLQYFLKKNPEDKGLWAAYDPYDHAIETPLNTQFGEAYKRPNLVVVRSLIPKSEIDEPFHADYALLPTGAHRWNNGRTLYLSRWSKIDKVLTREEEAKMIDEYWKKHPGKREALKSHRDYNRFVPQVRRELEKMGYRFELDGRELTPEESRALDEQNWESRDAIPGREGQLPFIGDEDIARINAKMAGKWVGEPKEAMENAMAARVNELAERLHTPVRIVRTAGEVAALPSARQRRMKGSFNPLTGEVTIVVPNNANMADVENTFVHEVVGHGGLRVLFPEEEKLDSALDELYRVSDGSIREAIDRTAKRMYDAEVDRLREKKRREHEARGEDANASYYADMAEAHAEASKKRGQFRRDATEEYGADLAGRIGEKGFEKMSAGEQTFWDRLKAMLQKALQKLLDGLGIPGKRKWSDKDWAFVLHEAYKRKKNGGNPTVFDAADTEVMRRKTGFGETKFSEGAIRNERAEELNKVNERFNEQLGTLTEKNADSVVFSLGRPSAVLKSAGVKNKPMKLYGNKVMKKMRKHGFALEELRDLPRAVADPVAVFNNYGEDGNRSILTELHTANGNFLVTISLGKGKDDIDFNIVSSVFGKGEDNIVDWLNRDLATYINKEKALNYLHHSALRAVTSESPRLNTAAKVVKDFVNPQTSDENVADEDIMFRDGDSVEYNKAMARDIYERRVRRGMYQVQEALQDSMLGLKEAMDAVLKAEGRGKTYIEDVAGYENAYLGENRLAGKNKAEADEFSRTLFKPMLEEVARLAKSADERAGLTDYMMAKHGLERNEVMARRAAEKDAAREFHAELRKAERAVAQDPQDQGAADALDDVKRRRHDREEELYLENRGRDYAGLTALTGKGSVAEAEAEARKMVADYEAGHDTRALWYRVNAVNAATLRKTYESGLISKATYDDISGMYAHYIPLRGFDEKTAEEAYAYLSDRHGAFSTPIKAARGRKSKADDPFANMEAMAESAIMQGNRNVLVKQKFLNFALNHPSDLVSVSDLWLWHNDATDEWQPVNSGDLKGTERIGEDDSPAEVERKMRDFEEAMEQAAKSDPAHYRRQKDAPDIPYRVVESRDLRQHQVLVKRNGRDYLLTVNGNPRAAQALNGLTNPDNDISGAIGVLMKSGEWVNRQLSAFYTTRNPDFVVSNFVRDLLYTNTMVWVKESPNYAWRFHKNFAKVNPARMKVLLAKLRKGTLDMNDGTERMFRLFMMNGGETGYANIRDIDKRKNDIRRELKRYNGQMPVRKAWSLLGERLDEYNRAVENCARFAAFMTSRQMGRTVDRSVYDAKEISVNFNKKGSGAKFMGATGQTKAGNVAAFTSGLGRSFYVFWNAAIQGTANFGRQFRRHPGKAIAGAASMFLLGALVASIGGDDGDGDGDEDAYWNLPDYVRRSNIVFRLPGMDRSWISLPLPVEYRAMYGMGELAVSAMSGRERHTPLELAHAMAGQVSQLFPIDFMEGGGGLKAFVPSPVKPVAEVIDNESWTGMPIYKDTPFNRDMPEWTKAYKSANKYLVGLSRALNEATGGDAYTSGAVDINPAQVEHLLNGTFGGVSQTIDKLTKTGETILGDREYDPRSFLLLNRLVKRGDERTEYRAINNEYFRIKEESEKLRKRMNRYENDTADGIFDYAEKIARINASPEYRMLETYEECSGDIDAINDELKEEMPDEERKSLEAELNQKKKELVDAVNAIRNGKR